MMAGHADQSMIKKSLKGGIDYLFAQAGID
jgi:hypothetical protein